jgi:hypothetical protein
MWRRGRLQRVRMVEGVVSMLLVRCCNVVTTRKRNHVDRTDLVSIDCFDTVECLMATTWPSGTVRPLTFPGKWNVRGPLTWKIFQIVPANLPTPRIITSTVGNLQSPEQMRSNGIRFIRVNDTVIVHHILPQAKPTSREPSSLAVALGMARLRPGAALLLGDPLFAVYWARCNDRSPGLAQHAGRSSKVSVQCCCAVLLTDGPVTTTQCSISQ